jgi:hypothetical protein
VHPIAADRLRPPGPKGRVDRARLFFRPNVEPENGGPDRARVRVDEDGGWGLTGDADGFDRAERRGAAEAPH